jgi:hypothetical protein
MRKSMDESAEAERIRLMEAQLQSFDPGAAARVGGGNEGAEDSESSDEEDSDDEE